MPAVLSERSKSVHIIVPDANSLRWSVRCGQREASSNNTLKGLLGFYLIIYLNPELTFPEIWHFFERKYLKLGLNLSSFRPPPSYMVDRRIEHHGGLHNVPCHGSGSRSQ